MLSTTNGIVSHFLFDTLIPGFDSSIIQNLSRSIVPPCVHRDCRASRVAFVTTNCNDDRSSTSYYCLLSDRLSALCCRKMGKVMALSLIRASVSSSSDSYLGQGGIITALWFFNQSHGTKKSFLCLQVMQFALLLMVRTSFSNMSVASLCGTNGASRYTLGSAHYCQGIPGNA